MVKPVPVGTTLARLSDSHRGMRREYLRALDSLSCLKEISVLDVQSMGIAGVLQRAMQIACDHLGIADAAVFRCGGETDKIFAGPAEVVCSTEPCGVLRWPALMRSLADARRARCVEIYPPAIDSAEGAVGTVMAVALGGDLSPYVLLVAEPGLGAWHQRCLELVQAALGPMLENGGLRARLDDLVQMRTAELERANRQLQSQLNAAQAKHTRQIGKYDAAVAASSAKDNLMAGVAQALGARAKHLAHRQEALATGLGSSSDWSRRQVEVLGQAARKLGGEAARLAYYCELGERDIVPQLQPFGPASFLERVLKEWLGQSSKLGLPPVQVGPMAVEPEPRATFHGDPDQLAQVAALLLEEAADVAASDPRLVEEDSGDSVPSPIEVSIELVTGDNQHRELMVQVIGTSGSNIGASPQSRPAVDDHSRSLALALADRILSRLGGTLEVLDPVLPRYQARVPESLVRSAPELGAEVPHGQTERFDQTVLDGLAVVLGPDLGEAVRSFVRELASLLDAVEEAVRQEDIEVAHRLATRGAGSCRNFGANRLASCVESLTRHDDDNVTQSAFVAVRQEFHWVESHLQILVQAQERQKIDTTTSEFTEN